MNVTIKDVAKAAGVSVATVSRVLNNSSTVSDKTTDHVNYVIKNLGYSPNFLGRNLRKCNTNTILAILPGTEQTFYSEILHGMQSAASENGYDVLFCTSNYIRNIEMHLLNMLFNRTVDAAILFGTTLDFETLKELNSKYYIALCCEKIENSGILTVSVDDENAAFDAVSSLIKMGHKKIAMISTIVKNSSSTNREKGYKKALEESNIKFKDNYLFRGSYCYDDGSRAFKYFMSLDEPPTAIFCISDLLAADAIKQAITMGYNVGNDVSICGFDNILLSDMFVPGITTIEQPCYNIGRTVVEKLIDCMAKGEKSEQHFKLNHKLILRDSVGRI